ncbi:MAG: cytochrome-c oxidase, cbb3-type subunit III [Pseudomonadota bacterium]
MSDFWSYWIIGITTLSFVVTIWVLFANRKRTPIDENTTGHVYDGIEEWDNPLPGWWFAMFVITIVWGIGYLIAYPGLGNFPGVLGWTSIEQHTQEVAQAEEKYRAMRDQYLALSIEEIHDDPKAQRMGMRVFGNNCSQCHGLDAAGAKGFPNLRDSAWLWGGSSEAIKHSITYGRMAAMPPWESVLGEQGVTEVTAYVQSLGAGEHDQSAVAAGKVHFQTFCMACHGADGKGNPLLGAPNLTDADWLYGGTAAQIAETVRLGRNGQMPAFQNSLSEDKIHLVAAYVFGLSQ